MSSSQSKQITTLTFLHYNSFLSKSWAFYMMQGAHTYLSEVEGLEFYKLMGSGKGMGFNPLPDWSTYAVLQIWKDEESADQFFKTSKLMTKYRSKCASIRTVFMKNVKAHGLWSGGNPFQVNISETTENGLRAVITRATIKSSKLIKFWRYVPTSEKPLVDNQDLLFTKGIGEVPISQMATFSIWKSEAAMKNFAYNSKAHQGAIDRTRKLDWYKEELFARFEPYRFEGNWSFL